MEAFFPSITITVAEKADREFAIVGAASIVAKVERDNNIEKHVYEEVELTRTENDVGSGYPAGWSTHFARFPLMCSATF